MAFPKISFLERGLNYFFNIIISYIFPENFIEITQVIQKIGTFSPSVWTIYIGIYFVETSHTHTPSPNFLKTFNFGKIHIAFSIYNKKIIHKLTLNFGIKMINSWRYKCLSSFMITNKKTFKNKIALKK